VGRDALPATGSVSVVVGAVPETLWGLVSDPSTPARFSRELVEASFVGGGPPRLGVEIEGRNENGSFTWTTRSTVVVCDEPSRFVWATGGAEAPAATWSFEVAPSGTGSTLTHRVVFHRGGEPLAPAIEAEPERAHEIVEARLAQVLEAMQRVVTGTAALAETADPTSRSG
jgi:Polyketide cyclase / dehydrase and lipid transport